ncbi:unnamed protein product [Pylaiella littoralis]
MSASSLRAFTVAPMRPRRPPRLILTICAVASSALGGACIAKTFPTPPASASAGAAARGVRTGVLIHGCHLGAKGWRKIMWGDEQQQRLGRLPHGVRLAWEENACVVVLGTGASELDGVVEGRYAVEYLIRNWDKLRGFNEAFSGVDLETMREAVQPSLVAEVRSQNTREELIEAGRIFRKENCDRVILVSSPTHVPRCLRDACSAWLNSSHHDSLPKDGAPSTRGEHVELVGIMEHGNGEDEGDWVGSGGEEAAKRNEEEDKERRRQRLRPWRPVILASPSGTSYADYGPGDVAIVEPPHRGDSAPKTPSLPHSARRASTHVASGGDPAAGTSKDVGEGYELGERGFKEPRVATAPMLLHELVALALVVGKGSEEQFRKEFQELLRRYTDNENT